MVVGKLYHMLKNEVGPFTLHHIQQLTLVKYLNIRHKTPRENRENLQSIRFGKDFLDMIPKAEATK